VSLVAELVTLADGLLITVANLWYTTLPCSAGCGLLSGHVCLRLVLYWVVLRLDQCPLSGSVLCLHFVKGELPHNQVVEFSNVYYLHFLLMCFGELLVSQFLPYCKGLCEAQDGRVTLSPNRSMHYFILSFPDLSPASSSRSGHMPERKNASPRESL
jgi:hypothetical protein